MTATPASTTAGPNCRSFLGRGRGVARPPNSGGGSTTSFIGTAGNDNFTGTATSDSFDLSQGGNDTAKGGNYWDSFSLGGALTAADRINGGAGYDYLFLDGDYSGGLVLDANSITNVESWYFTPGHSYDITVKDGTNQDNNGISINAGNLGASDILLRCIRGNLHYYR